MTAAPWPRRAAFALVAAVTVLLLALAFGPHSVADYYAETDFLGGYAPGARAIQAGHLDAARYVVTGPVYDVTLALVAAVTRNIEVAGKLIAALAAAATMLLWFLLLERRAGAAAALWTLAFLAVNPIFVRYGSSLTTDMLASATQAAALYALFGRHGRRVLPWAGALAALAALTRFNAVYLLPVALWSDPVRESRGAASRLRAVLLFAAGFACVALPWLAFSLASGHVPGEALFHDLAFDAFAKAKGISWDEYANRMQPGFRSLGDVLRHDPGELVQRLFGNLREHAALDVERVLRRPAAIACALGALLAIGGGLWRPLLPVWAAGLLLYLSLVPVFHSERYSLALAPFYLSFAGAGVASAALAWRPRGWPAAVSAKWIFALAALVAGAVVCAGYQRQVLRDLPREVRPAAAALRASTRGDATARVIARKPHLAFYAGVTHVPFPAVGTLGELAAFCREHGVKYLYFSMPEAEMRPEFTYLLDRDADVPGLEPVAFAADWPARLYRIGPDFGATPAWFAVDSLRTLRVSRSLESIGTPRWRIALVCGLYAMSENDAAASARHFEALTRLRPDYAQGFFLAGQSNRALGRHGEAIERYRRALALDANMAAAWEGLGWSLLLSGDIAGAASAWRPIVAATADPVTLERMAAVFERMGDPAAADAARAALERATRAGPGAIPAP